MKLRCWGCRGSIPVSGVMYNIYGGDTTCFEIRSQSNEVIIIDAGSGIRRLGNQLLEENINKQHLIFTHAHWDHILGFPFFKPAYHPENSISIYGCAFAQDSIREMVAGSMKPPYFPIPLDYLKAHISYRGLCESEILIDDIHITSIPLSHPNQGLGYKFIEKNKSLVILTDNELGFVHENGKSYENYVEFVQNTDLLLHDGEFKPEEYELTKTWGHSTYIQACDLAIDAGVASLGIVHHNQNRSDKELKKIISLCNSHIKKRNSSVHCFAVAQDQEVEL